MEEWYWPIYTNSLGPNNQADGGENFEEDGAPETSASMAKRQRMDQINAKRTLTVEAEEETEKIFIYSNGQLAPVETPRFAEFVDADLKQW